MASDKRNVLVMLGSEEYEKLLRKLQRAEKCKSRADLGARMVEVLAEKHGLAVPQRVDRRGRRPKASKRQAVRKS